MTAAQHQLEENAGFGALLRSLRRRAGLTQDALADLSRLGVRTIRDLEVGRTLHPRHESARLLADALALGGEVRDRFEQAAAGQLGPWISSGSATLPSQLPPDTPDFSGRVEQVAELRQLLRLHDPVATVTVIAGPPGVGKTALAVHVAHELKSLFPDGQLYADLRGGEAPFDAVDILASFVHAIQVGERAVPATPHERIALYRTLLADRRVLLLLDNAVSESQVRPLLPGGAHCRTLVTSRHGLAALEGVRVLPLGVLEPAESVQLLARVAGSQRVEAEPGAAVAIAAMCGGLPLAVRVAGGRLAARPHWPIDRLAELLRDKRRRLSELAVGDLSVRTSIGSSYRRLDEPARRAFRLLALLCVPHFAAWTAAPLLALPPGEAEELVEQLVDAQLLEVRSVDATGTVRYEFQELIRLYGQERSEEEDPRGERLNAISRAAAAWLHLAYRAVQRKPSALLSRGRPMTLGATVPDILDVVPIANPKSWFEAEEAAMASMVETAGRLGLDRLATEIASVLWRAQSEL